VRQNHATGCLMRQLTIGGRTKDNHLTVAVMGGMLIPMVIAKMDSEEESREAFMFLPKNKWLWFSVPLL
jgi:hypothetical protein